MGAVAGPGMAEPRAVAPRLTSRGRPSSCRTCQPGPASIRLTTAASVNLAASRATAANRNPVRPRVRRPTVLFTRRGGRPSLHLTPEPDAAAGAHHSCRLAPPSRFAPEEPRQGPTSSYSSHKYPSYDPVCSRQTFPGFTTNIREENKRFCTCPPPRPMVRSIHSTGRMAAFLTRPSPRRDGPRISPDHPLVQRLCRRQGSAGDSPGRSEASPL